MATVKMATIDLFDQIYPLIHHFDIKGLSREDWQRLLECNWSSRHDHFGYVLMEGDEVVGFLGTFFYERIIDGTTCHLCNLFCWYVLEKYRKQSLMLILAVLNLKDTTITSLTPSREAGLILERFKFVPLESSVKIFSVFSAFGSSISGTVVTDTELIRARLSRNELSLFEDHSLPGSCNHLVFEPSGDKDSPCYVVYNTVRKKRISFTQVYYVSDPDIFSKSFPRIQRFFFKTNHCLFTVIDKRLLLDRNPALGFDYTLRYPRLYRTSDLTPQKVDNLYTELLFLKRV